MKRIFALLAMILMTLTASAQHLIDSGWERQGVERWEKLVVGGTGAAVLHIQKLPKGLGFGVTVSCGDGSTVTYQWKTGDNRGKALRKCPGAKPVIEVAPWTPHFNPLPEDLFEERKSSRFTV